MQWKNYYTDTDVDTSFGTISKSVANGLLMFFKKSEEQFEAFEFARTP